MTRLLALLLVIPAWAQLQPKFDVIRATYGAGSTQADVTERVRSKIVNGGLNIQVNADTLGIDPVPNTRKTLTVYYRQGRIPNIARANDFETLRLGNAPAEALRITKAQYGDGRRMKDVTEILNGKITASRLELVINNANLGGDPAPAVKKAITVDYEYNGRAATAKLAEGETLRLPEGVAVPTLTIAKALYTGGRRGSSDVTGAVAALVTGDTLELTVNPSTLGADPASGFPKTLSVEYDYKGQRQTVTARDGEVLRINKTGPATNLRIVRALYTGGRAGSADVTGAVSALLSGDSLEVPVNASTLGSDPAPGFAKTLSVEYEYNGQRQTGTARDGEVLRINKAAPAASTFRIVSASYSGGRRLTADVTRAVTARATAEGLELTVNGDTLGGDPAPGTVKTLTVEYEVNGQRQTATAKDSETLILPPVTSLLITRATYGVPGRTVDATSAVNSRRTGLRLELPVNGDTFQSDPAPGVVKTLTVEYEANGRRRTATAQDGETLRIPGAGANQKGPIVMAVDSGTTRTVCLYRLPNYTGETVCFSTSQSAIGQSGFRSLKLNGAAAVDVYEQPNFAGRSQSITADVPDLLLLPGNWWRYEVAAPIQSARAR
jgi:hypothetical protein